MHKIHPPFLPTTAHDSPRVATCCQPQSHGSPCVATCCQPQSHDSPLVATCCQPQLHDSPYVANWYPRLIFLLPVRVQYLPVVSVSRRLLEVLNLELVLYSEFTTQSRKQHMSQYPLYVSPWIQTRVFYCWGKRQTRAKLSSALLTKMRVIYKEKL